MPMDVFFYHLEIEFDFCSKRRNDSGIDDLGFLFIARSDLPKHCFDHSWDGCLIRKNSKPYPIQELCHQFDASSWNKRILPERSTKARRKMRSTWIVAISSHVTWNFTPLKASRVQNVFAKPCTVDGLCVFVITITSIRWISIGNKCQLHWYNLSSKSSNWFVTNWPHWQRKKIKMNDQVTKIDCVKISIGFGFGCDCKELYK